MAWTKYKEIKYALGGIPTANLTDFPKLVSIVADSDIASELSGGGGVKFTSADGSSDLDFGLYPSSALASGTVLARVKIGSLLTAASVGDVIARLYYSSSESTTEDKAGTVSNGYALFMPLDEDPSGSAPQMRDWVTDTLLGTSNGSMTSGDLVTGQVGRGLDFDGSNDRIATTVSVGSSFTLEAWVYPRTTGGGGFGRVFSANEAIVLSPTGSGGGPFRLNVNGSLVETGAIPFNQWIRLSVVRDAAASQIRIYANGSLANSATNATIGTQTNLQIGDRTAGSRGWDGLLDEVTSCNAVRSADWIAYGYADDFTNSGTFTLSAEQTSGGSSPTAVARRRRSRFGRGPLVHAR